MNGIDPRWSKLAPQFRAAATLAQLVAKGHLDVDGCLADLAKAAATSAPSADPSGRRMVVAHALHDQIEAAHALRASTERAILSGLEPLLARRASSRDLIAHASAINQQAGGAVAPLDGWEVRAAAEKAVGWHLARLRRAAAAAPVRQRA